MPEDSSTDSKTTRLFPVMMPGAIAPVLGEWPGRGLCVGENPDAFFPSTATRGRRPGGSAASAQSVTTALRT